MSDVIFATAANQKVDFHVLKSLFDQSKIENSHWHDQFDDVDPISADREFVHELLESAPTNFLRGYVSGIVVVRQQVAILTGRAFDEESPIILNMGYLEKIAPEWAAEVDELDVVSASRADITEFLRTAPCLEATGFLAGVLMFRTQISICTESNF